MKKQKMITKSLLIPETLMKEYDEVLRKEDVEFSTDIRRMIRLRLLVSKTKQSVKDRILKEIEKEREK